MKKELFTGIESQADAELINRLQQVDHPTLAAEKASVQVTQLKAAARAQRTASAQKSWRWILAVTGTVAVVTLVVIGVMSGLLGNVQQVQAASLDNVSGIVEITNDIGKTWTVVEDGEELAGGGGIRTYAGSSVLLTFPDGSIVQVGEEAEVYVTTLEYSKKTLKLVMLQTAGETTHWVVPIKEGGQYLVNTMTGTAQVHGTVFNVNVPDTGLARFAVTDGIVAVSNAGSEVLLAAGQATLAEIDGTLVPAAYDFSLKGELEAISADGNWTVSGVSFMVTEDTRLKGEFVVGDFVHVIGRVLESGERVADMIMYSQVDKEILCFSGTVENISETEWVISGQSVVVNSDTILGEGLEVGSLVEVRFIVQDDGSWLALKISQFSDEQGPPEKKPTKQPREPVGQRGNMNGTGEPVREMEGTPGPEKEQGVCDPETEQIQPEAARLAERYGVTYQEIMTWFCLNYGFGEIDLAYSISLETGIPVTEIFAMRESGTSWGLIKQTLVPNEKPIIEPEQNNNNSDLTPGPDPNPNKGKN